MHIKKIIIEGFKSYGERIVVGPFDPGHNVIVGPNGSGKSNFFAAIQFVLSDELSRWPKDQRHALLHEGSKSRSMSATVEIIFDNSDRRITVDKSEVSLKRVIGAKKDQYILNKTVVTRSEVISLMEVAGFSRSNPYYIVRQGKINAVATTPESRLMLLQEIAGVKVYEDRRNESKAILDDTRLRIKNIDELLDTIHEKLETLKEETDELKEYLHWDKKTRTIEFIIYENELATNKNKLQNLKRQHEELKTGQGPLQTEVTNLLDQIKNTYHDLKRAQMDATIAEEEKDHLSKELEKLLTREELLCLTINELNEEIKVDNEKTKDIKDKLEKLNKEIEETQTKLGVVKPKYEEAVEKADKIIRNLESKEQERQTLYARKGRGVQFQNKEERNAWINKELSLINRQIDEKVEHIQNLECDVSEDDQKLKELEKTRNMILDDLKTQYSSIYEFKKLCIDYNKKKEENLAKRKDFYKNEKDLQQDLAYLEEDLKRVDQDLISMYGKGIFNGIKSANKVLKTFEERADMANETYQYRGLVIKCFQCDSKFYKAVEVIGGPRLYHHVIDTAKFGNEILKEINRQGLPGIVTFMPLDRLKSKEPIYPKESYAIPLLETLRYEGLYEIPIRYIFGNAMVTRDLKIGTEIARKHRLECVTLVGDQVSSKGWLKGGHFGVSKSPMKMQEEEQKLNREIDSKRKELSELNAQIKGVDKEITSCTSQIQNNDTKYSKARETYDKLTNDLNNVKEQLEIVKNNLILQRKNLQELKSDLNTLNVLKQNLEDELGQDLNDQLTEADKDQINSLNNSVTQLKKDLKNLFQTRETLETEKIEFENLLNKNLNCKKKELEDTLREIGLENKQLLLFESEGQYNIIQNKIKSCTEDSKKNGVVYEKTNKKKEDKLQEIENLYAELKPKQEKFENKSKELEKLFCNIKMLEENIQNTKIRMNALGLISSNELKSRYSKMSMNNLYKELDNCRKNLKNYEHVNKKALDQYEIFKEHKENLFKRKEELDRASKKIHQLFEFLQQKRHEAVQFTFKQVSKYFSEIFSKIVPLGKAQLVMEQGTSRNGSESSSTTTTTLDLDNLVGIGIRVSFTGQITAMKDYNYLSGGEKSLIALTLIFAIQKCDPAPFYLFDEIDHALDTAHRKAVAQMIHELSSDAQFITTTFRPELLEHANQFYGVRFQNNLSSIYNVSREDALEFVQPDEAD